MESALQIETIKINNFNKKLQNELDYFKGNNNTNIFTNLQEHNINERTELLEKLLNMPIKKQNTLQQQKDNLFKEIEKYTYKKQWNKLIPFHKIVKLKEYIKENAESIGNEQIQNEILEQLIKYANEGRINTKKYIIYDPNAEKILAMPCLIIDLEKNTYQLKVV